MCFAVFAWVSHFNTSHACARMGRYSPTQDGAALDVVKDMHRQISLTIFSSHDRECMAAGYIACPF